MESLTVAGALGILVPMIVAILTKLNTAPWIKGTLAVVLCLAVGGVTAGTSGFLPGDFWGQVGEIVKYVGVTAVAAQTAFSMFLKPAGWTSWLQENVGVTESE